MLWCALFLTLLGSARLVSGTPAEETVASLHSSASHIHGLLSDEHLRLPSVHYNDRRKRQASWNSDDTELDDSSTCLLRCTFQLQAAARRLKVSGRPDSLDNDGENDVTKSTFNMTRFNEVCSAMRPPVQCFDSCPFSALKLQVKDSLDAIRYMCIDRYQAIKDNARCMQKANRDITPQCTPRCRRYEEAVNRTKQLGTNPYLAYVYSAEQLREMLGGTCDYIQCHLDCNVPKMRTICGNVAGDLVRDITQKAMAALRNYDRIVAGGQALPASCRRLAQGQGGSDDSDTDRGNWQSTNQGNREIPDVSGE